MKTSQPSTDKTHEVDSGSFSSREDGRTCAEMLMRSDAEWRERCRELREALEAMLDAHPVTADYYRTSTPPLLGGEQKNYDAICKAEAALAKS